MSIASADGYFVGVQITHINLLVCDECHRAVKKDPYNCIMQEFYHDRATQVGLHLYFTSHKTAFVSSKNSSGTYEGHITSMKNCTRGFAMCSSFLWGLADEQ